MIHGMIMATMDIIATIVTITTHFGGIIATMVTIMEAITGDISTTIIMDITIIMGIITIGTTDTHLEAYPAGKKPIAKDILVGLAEPKVQGSLEDQLQPVKQTKPLEPPDLI